MSYFDHSWKPARKCVDWWKRKAWRDATTTSNRQRRRLLLDTEMFAESAEASRGTIDHVWRAIDATPNLTWLVFTRQPDKVRRTIPIPANGRDPADPRYMLRENLWLGVDIATQQEADDLIPQLLKCRELCGRLVVRVTVTERIDLFAMCEHHPQDGPYHEGGFWHAATCPSYCDYACGGKEYDGKPIDWLILQGDVGRSARPCNVAHVRELVRQAREVGVPCWVERLGSRCDFGDGGPASWMTARILDPHGADPTEWPEDLRAAREVPT